MTLAVRGRQNPHARHVFLPRNPPAPELDELLQTLRFRSAPQQHVFEVKVVHRLRQRKAQQRMIRIRALPLLIRNHQPPHPHRLNPQFRRRGRHILIGEVLHLAPQIRLLLIERHQQKTPLAPRHHVEAPVFEPLHHALHRNRTAGVHNAAILRQHDAEFRSRRLRLPHHLAVAVFKDMERNRRPGQGDKLQWEKRQQPVHLYTIIFKAAAALPLTRRNDILTSSRRRHFMQSLADKVVIVTGASDGIGARLASVLHRRGARLVLTARGEAKLREQAHPEDLIVAGDLTSESTRTGLIERTLARFGRIDVLINNAGRGSYYPASEAPLDDARALFELNFFAPLHLAQLAAPALRESRGTIVNVSSIAGCLTLPWLPLYSASKFALTSLSASQRMELSRDGVNVLSVFPGYVNTDFQTHAAGSAPPGRIVKGKRFAISADGCALAIVRGIERRKRVVVTPRSGWALVWLNRLSPALLESRLEAV